MKEGTIVRKLEDKGFGFIKSNMTEYFFHHSGCKTRFDDLQLGDIVRFEIEQSAKGPRASSVEKA